MILAAAGTGYIWINIATLLAQYNHVTVVDVIPEKVGIVINKISPIQDNLIEKYLAEKGLDLMATLNCAAPIRMLTFTGVPDIIGNRIIIELSLDMLCATLSKPAKLIQPRNLS